ncbi:MAG: DUF4230 domain-containing protein [Lachnospiraceae bacterium]|nr:DUF4230 domain-containing protein [Lachnospiraceae bacterium]
MGKNNSNGSRHSMKTTVIVLVFLVLIAAIFGAKLGMDYQQKKADESNHRQAITSDILHQQMEQIGELATVSYFYTNMGKFEDALQLFDRDVPLTKKSFTISYDGVIKAGVKLSEVGVSVAGNEIIIEIPQATIVSNDIDMESVVVYDEKSSIFNGLSTEDVTSFLNKQNILIEEKAMNNGILDTARQNAMSTLKLLIGRVVEDDTYEEGYTVQVVLKDS